MAQNDFLLWATGANANVLSQAEYAGLGNRSSGVVAGVASGKLYNKQNRQASIISSMIAQFISDRLNADVIDDGTIATIEANFTAAVRSVFSIPNTGVVPGTYGPTMTLSVQADGRITALSSTGLTSSGVPPGTYVGTTITVAADGRITAISGVPYGQIGGDNNWQGGNTFNHLDNGGNGGQFRAVQGSYGSMWRNDGSSTYLLSTAAGQQTGIWSAYRPFYWNMATGAVTIDGTASGVNFGGAISTGQGITAGSGNITANSGRLRAGLGAFGSGDAFAGVILSDVFLGGNLGNDDWSYMRLPSGYIIQTYRGATTNGGEFITFPVAFPNACLQVLVHEGNPQGWIPPAISFVSPTIFGTQQLSANAFALYCVRYNSNATWFLAGGIAFRYIAIGY
jgi:hypothetical protein